MSKKALVVDDEKAIVKGIKFSLEQDDMIVDCAYDGQEAIDMAKTNEYDIILLDVMLPVFTGFEVCQQIREFSNVPIIMLTAKGDDMDKILGLEYGADDYITKPFNILEVKARIKAIIRRTTKAPSDEHCLIFGDLKLNEAYRRVFVKDKEVNVTSREYELLELLIHNPGKVYSREELLETIWGSDYPGDERTVDVHIRRLREKLEVNPSEPRYVRTKWGSGYYFQGMISTSDMAEFFKQINIRNILKSLRVRFFIIVFVTGFASCFVMHTLILDSYEDRAVNVRSSEIQTQLRILANHLITYNYLQDTSSEVINAELDMLANLYDGRVMVINDDLKVVKDTYNISQGKTIISEEVVKCLKTGSKGTVSKYDSANGYIEMITPIITTEMIEEGDVTGSSTSNEVVRGVLLTSVSTDTIDTTLAILSKRATTLETIIVIVILVFAVLVSHALLRPFDRITAAINDVKAGYTDDPVIGPNYYETEQIINAFNALLRRMKVLDDSRQEFVSNVSHELKTPITSIKVLADSLLSQENVPNEVYREFMQDIGAEIDREDKIINDLLALVKMDKKASGLNITSVDVVLLTEVVLKRMKPIAQRRNIDLTLESKRTITAEIDEVKISLVIMNLVENAIKYNRDNGWVKVELDADHQYFTVKVMDSGIGIPGDSLDHIYERFYRVDKSRSREIGGTGLGLAIARNAVLMHRGTIDVTSTVDEGTIFTVKIPLISNGSKVL